MTRAVGEKLIASNPKAFHDYFIEEKVEAGMVLSGTEVKSIRAQSPGLGEAHIAVFGERSGNRLEAWILNLHLAPYEFGNIWNHEPRRKRKLLLHRHQIDKLFGATTQKGMTIVPLRLYFKNGRVKIELGLGKGKKKHDKRDDMKKKSAEKEMRRAIGKRG